jgi:hypothetical protein
MAYHNNMSPINKYQNCTHHISCYRGFHLKPISSQPHWGKQWIVNYNGFLFEQLNIKVIINSHWRALHMTLENGDTHPQLDEIGARHYPFPIRRNWSSHVRFSEDKVLWKVCVYLFLHTFIKSYMVLFKSMKRDRQSVVK